MQAAEQALAALGCPKINLQVRADNIGVINLYRVLGYKMEDRVSMGKPISNHRAR
jgi:ribosomal protein S18 acetylase RimI-like enzyme